MLAMHCSIVTGVAGDTTNAGKCPLLSCAVLPYAALCYPVVKLYSSENNVALHDVTVKNNIRLLRVMSLSGSDTACLGPPTHQLCCSLHALDTAAPRSKN